MIVLLRIHFQLARDFFNIVLKPILLFFTENSYILECFTHQCLMELWFSDEKSDGDEKQQDDQGFQKGKIALEGKGDMPEGEDNQAVHSEDYEGSSSKKGNYSFTLEDKVQKAW